MVCSQRVLALRRDAVALRVDAVALRGDAVALRVDTVGPVSELAGSAWTAHQSS